MRVAIYTNQWKDSDLACQNNHTKCVKLLAISILNDLTRPKTGFLSFFGDKLIPAAAERLLAFINNQAGQSTLTGYEKTINANRDMKNIFDYYMKRQKSSILKRYLKAKYRSNIATMQALEQQVFTLLVKEKMSLEANVVYAIIQLDKQQNVVSQNKDVSSSKLL